MPSFYPDLTLARSSPYGKEAFRLSWPAGHGYWHANKLALLATEVVAVKTTIDLTDTLMRQADGLPVFRRDPAVAPQIPSLQELWELEHTTLAAEDQQRACFPG